MKIACKDLLMLIVLFALTLSPAWADDSPASPSAPSGDGSAALPSPNPAIAPNPTVESSTSSQPLPASGPGIDSPAPNAVAPAVAKPSGPPPGLKDAVNLYNQRKFAPALAKLQQLVKDGTADDDTHRYIAGSYQQLKKYSKAAAEYEWISKNARSMTTRRQAAEAARTIRSQMAGVCPMPCLKESSPWQRLTVAGHPPTDRWVKYSYPGGWNSYNQNHMGHLIKYDGRGPAQDVGVCPSCGGTGKVKALKDQ